MKARLTFACLAAVALALAGCGSEAVSLDPVAQAAEQTQAVESYHFSIRGSGMVTFEGEGESEGARSRMRMSFRSAGQTQTMDAVSDGTVMYMRMPGLAAGKEWLRIDLAKLGEESGVDFDQLLDSSPQQSLEQLLQSTDSTRIGTEVVGGVMTTHYRVTVSGEVPGISTEFLEEIEPEYGPMHVWVDEQGRIRRIRSSSSFLQDGSRVRQSLTMELYDFGLDVDVEPPPGDLVVDIEDMT